MAGYATSAKNVTARRFGALGIDIVCVGDVDIEEALHEAEPVRDAHMLVIVGRRTEHDVEGDSDRILRFVRVTEQTCASGNRASQCPSLCPSTACRTNVSLVLIGRWFAPLFLHGCATGRC